MSLNLGTAFIDVVGDFSQFNRGVDDATGGASGKFGKMGKVAAVGIAAIGAAAVVVGKELYNIGAAFDDASDSIRVTTGKTGKSLKGLEADFKAVVKTTPTDFGSASKAVGELNQKLGLSGKPLQKMSKQVLELSRLTETDLSANIKSTTRVFGDWGIKTGDQSAALDKLFRASQKTGVPVAQLGDSIVKFGAPLRQLGFSFEQSAAMVGKFEKEGVNTQLVMGSMRVALGKLAKAGKDPQVEFAKTTEAIKNAGSAGEANALALELFGGRAGPDMAAAIREGRFELGDLVKQIDGGSDTILKASADTADFAETWQVLKNRVWLGLEPIATRVFGGVAKAITLVEPAAAAVGSAFETFKGLLNSSGEGGGRLTSTLGSLQRAFQGVRDVVSTVVVYAKALWAEFGDDIIAGIRNVVDLASGLVEAIARVLEGVVDFVAGVLTLDLGRAWDGIKNIFGGVWDAIKALVDAALDHIGVVMGAAWELIRGGLQLAWTAIRDWLSGLWEDIKAKASEKWNAVKDRIIGAVAAVRDWLSGAWAAIRDRAAEVWGGIRDRAAEFWTGVKNRVIDPIREARDWLSVTWGTIRDRASEVWASIRERASDVWDGIKARIVGAVRDARDTVSEVWESIKKRASSAFGDLRDAASDFAGGFKDKIVSAFSGAVRAVGGFINSIIGILNKIPGVDIPAVKFEVTADRAQVDGFAQGGVTHHDAVKRGSHLTKPMMIVGEEAPRHPEFIVPTNPAYRGRALGLFGQLGAQLGIPGFATGGVLGKVGDVLSGGASALIGKLPGLGNLPDWLKGTGRHVLGKAGDYIKDKIKKLLATAVAAGGKSAKGLVPQVLGAISFARQNGWGGAVVSGFRTFAEQQELYRRYLNGTGNLAAKPGTSNHEGGQAIDVSDTEGFARAMNAMGEGRLYRRIPGEPWHFSVSGYRQGGVVGPGILGPGGVHPYVGAYERGGVVPQTGMALVHKGETITPEGSGDVYLIQVGDGPVERAVDVQVTRRERAGAALAMAGVR